MADKSTGEYCYSGSGSTYSDTYLWPALRSEIEPLRQRGVERVFDLGCGNGMIAGELAQLGFEVTGVDISKSGIAIASTAHPRCHFEVASVYDDLAGRFGRFPLVVSLEVVEHLFDPRRYARTLFDLLEPGGIAIVSTPYHGYLKNLVLAATGRLEGHFTALWDGGHIKFFSIDTLGRLLSEVGFVPIRFTRVGRIPPIAKSMMAFAVRPV